MYYELMVIDSQTSKRNNREVTFYYCLYYPPDYLKPINPTRSRSKTTLYLLKHCRKYIHIRTYYITRWKTFSAPLVRKLDNNDVHNINNNESIPDVYYEVSAVLYKHHIFIWTTKIRGKTYRRALSFKGLMIRQAMD